MDQLWAPWRLANAVKPATPQPAPACFVCAGLAAHDDRTNLIVWRTTASVVVLNKFPYNNGHLLVAPHRHVGQLTDATRAELLDMQETLQVMLRTLERTMKPDGFNIGLNLGQAAGAGLPGHLHWHIVPRWNGDTNFMPIFTDTKVIVQSLDALYDLLQADLHRSASASGAALS
jgi:ATP adenylyltransferase